MCWLPVTAADGRVDHTVDYVALLMPVVTLVALPLIDRLERWALLPDLLPAPAEPDDAARSSPVEGSAVTARGPSGPPGWS